MEQYGGLQRKTLVFVFWYQYKRFGRELIFGTANNLIKYTKILVRCTVGVHWQTIIALTEFCVFF